MDSIKCMKDLIKKLDEASYAYYQKDNPIMTDKLYDALYDKLTSLENETGVVLSNSPTQKVQGFLLDGLKKVNHTVPMLSAAKTKDLEEVKKFINKKDALCSYKIDGLTIIVRYENGILKEAITRGNGYIGEDVTEQAKFIENLPMKIPYKDRLELRGECVISWDNFKKINDELEVPYSHPRNLAAGSIRQLDTTLVKQRHLELIIFDLIIGELFNYKDQAFD